ncbi:MAG: type IVB secretion system protein IcmH/DotU [Xanthomonadaceae bacterium]|nr:type IVB secretion system protein IcmH/DotU [Xanthomonadaceae bacterium]
MNRSYPSTAAAPVPSRADARPGPDGALPNAPRSLLDLMADGFYLLMLLKRGQLPTDAEHFVTSIQSFLDKVEHGAAKLDICAEDIYAAQYAFCAAVDEAILSQPSPIRDDWERSPLQLRLFSENLAGEHFFDRLEDLRAQGAPRLSSLEVYHYCLLLGFEGKYRLEGLEKLGYLTARLGDEIALLKGKRVGFAPYWPTPDNVAHALRRVVPLWAPALVLAVAGLLGYIVFSTLLGRQTDTQLAAYQDVVQLPARTAHITITLP